MDSAKFRSESRRQLRLIVKLKSQIQGHKKQLEQLIRDLRNYSKAASSRRKTRVSKVSQIKKVTKTTVAPPQPIESYPPSLDIEQLEIIRGKFRYECKYARNSKHVFRPIAPRDGSSRARGVEIKQRRVETLITFKGALKQEIVALGRRCETAAATKNYPVLRLSAVPYQISEEIDRDRQQKISIVKSRMQAENEERKWESRKEEKAKVSADKSVALTTKSEVVGCLLHVSTVRNSDEM